MDQYETFKLQGDYLLNEPMEYRPLTLHCHLYNETDTRWILQDSLNHTNPRRKERVRKVYGEI